MVEAMERLESAETLSERELIVVSQFAAEVVAGPIPEGERFLDDMTCMELAAAAAAGVPTDWVRADLEAKASRDRYLLLREPPERSEVVAIYRRHLENDPPPRPVTAGLLALDIVDLLRLDGDLPGARAAARDSERWMVEVEPTLPGMVEGMRVRLASTRGRIELELGRPELAFDHYELASDLAALLGGAALQEQRVNQLVYFTSIDDHAEVVRLSGELLEDLNMRGDLRALIHIERGLARLELARVGRAELDDARADLELGLASGIPADRITANLRLVELELEQGALDRARTQLSALVGEGESEPSGAGWTPMLTAQHAFLSWRSRIAKEGGEAEVASDLERHRQRLASAQEGLRQAWLRTKRLPGGAGFLNYPSRCEPLGALIDAEMSFAEPDTSRAFTHLIRSQLLGSFARARDLQVPDVDAVRASLPEGGTLLAYLFAPGGSHLFVLDAGRLSHHPLVSSRDLKPEVEAFFELLSTRRVTSGWSKRVAGKAQALRKAVLPDAVIAQIAAGAEEGSAPRVTFVGAGQLGVFPVEALLLADGGWLGSSWAVDHWPSIPVAVDLAARSRMDAARARSGRLAWIAPQTERDGLEPITRSPEQLRAFEDAWGDLRVHAGKDASESALRTATLADAELALVYAHGIFDPSLPIPAGFALEPDGKQDGDVWFDEVHSLGGAPRTVVLGVCSAARGALRLGEDGATHMGGAWLAAGAQRVILSAFALGAESTWELLEELGREVEAGAGLAEAMRAARSAVAEERPAPIHHQLLQLVGWSD